MRTTSISSPRDTAGPLFRDRRDAGRRLAERLGHLRSENPVVVGLPRGGVPVAFEVAKALSARLEVVPVRKLGALMQPELAIGAVGEDGTRVVDPRLAEVFGLGERELDEIAARELAEARRRARLYRGERVPVSVRGRTAILVDDGVATGSTARAAARILRSQGAERVVLAVPVGPPGVEERFAGEVDECVCLHTPEHFFAVGQWYERFDQTTDAEVRELLRDAGLPTADPPRVAGGIDGTRVAEYAMRIEADGRTLPGDLRLPPAPIGLVIFAHGSGSSRLSPRNRQVATALNGSHLATLLFDLLTDDEAADRRNVFDIPLLAGRLLAATRAAREEPRLRALPIGYFGASTGAAAALWAAAELGDDIRAVVSRGGRPDLAERRLADVSAPTLLLVGGYDWSVIDLNEQAAEALRCEHDLVIVPRATHLFEEPGALEEAARRATLWFVDHLPGQRDRRATLASAQAG